MLLLAGLVVARLCKTKPMCDVHRFPHLPKEAGLSCWLCLNAPQAMSRNTTTTRAFANCPSSMPRAMSRDSRIVPLPAASGARLPLQITDMHQQHACPRHA